MPPASRPVPDLRRAVALPGWVLLPLRGFLGVTFTYAGLQKLADKNYFDSSSPSSVQAQMHAYARSSPIHPLLTLASHQGVIVGLLIAFAELAVGVGALLGLWTRVAAAGGIVLSLAFLLSVSWHTHPYYLGPDIVFLFAWIPLLLAGAGDVLSLDAYLTGRARREMHLAPSGTVSIEFAAVRKLCGAYDRGRCLAMRNRPCDPKPCPVLAARPALEPQVAEELDRRTFLRKSSVALRIGVAAVGLGGATAIVGRALAPSRSRTAARFTARLGGATGSSSTTGAPPTAPPATTRTTTAGPTAPPTTAAPAPTTGAPRPAGTAIGSAAAVPIGGAASFDDPRTGNPAYVVQPRSGEYRAFSAVCTHQGCTVGYSGGGRFVCPCHGAEFDASSGTVLQGPAQRPLPRITVQHGPDGQLYVS